MPSNDPTSHRQSSRSRYALNKTSTSRNFQKHLAECTPHGALTRVLRGPLQELRIFYDRAEDDVGEEGSTTILLVVVAATRKRAKFDGAGETGEGERGRTRRRERRGGESMPVTRVARFQECGARSQPMPAARQ